MEGLIYVVGNLRYKIDLVSLQLGDCVTVPFWPCFILYLREISKSKCVGLYLGGRFNQELFVFRVWWAYICRLNYHRERVRKPNFCFDLSHRRSTTVSLETRNSFIFVGAPTWRCFLSEFYAMK